MIGIFSRAALTLLAGNIRNKFTAYYIRFGSNYCTTMRVIEQVQGYDNCCNTVLETIPSESYQTTCDDSFGKNFGGDVIFFPGDIQNYRQQMEAHYQCKDYVEFCYENCLELLATEKFPQCRTIWMVVPSKRAYGIICVYKNFVPSESVMGVPKHSGDFTGLRHIAALVDTLSSSNDQNAKSNLALVGFSKGCVVLNQLLYEISQLETGESGDALLQEFIQRIKAMYWLDGGHSGEEDTWVADPDVISCLTTKMDLYCVEVHVSPYQVRDEHRPWKGRSHSEFLALLKDAGVTLKNVLHFENDEPDLLSHFKVLQTF